MVAGGKLVFIKIGQYLYRRAARLKTFQKAREELLGALSEEGWQLSPRHLKIPHATSPDGGFRLWFKRQAVWYTQLEESGDRHSYKDARSLHVDIREKTPEELLDWVAKFHLEEKEDEEEYWLRQEAKELELSEGRDW